MDIGVVFGKVLREKRQSAGLTQEQLAYDAGIQRNYVSLMERGVNQPTLTVLFKIADALKCSPSVLVQGVETALRAIDAKDG